MSGALEPAQGRGGAQPGPPYTDAYGDPLDWLAAYGLEATADSPKIGSYNIGVPGHGFIQVEPGKGVTKAVDAAGRDVAPPSLLSGGAANAPRRATEALEAAPGHSGSPEPV